MYLDAITYTQNLWAVLGVTRYISNALRNNYFDE